MDTLFRALDDPTRRRILELLRTRDMNAGEIAAEFSISKPSISHHLDLLKQAGLIVAERSGQFLVYSLNTSVLEDCIGWMMKLKGKRDEKAERRVAATVHSRGAILRRRPALG